ncbi:hypothetical protein [Amycolatopsis sp. 195334CR]|uniref:hypothetical protein n=1 Tax=Amycolatopsis sp. 195334CR TaxID=2814588 RepID=UPI001A8CEA96|nr:hypothetical protein [Amycolatopsis sp. 195334CR]MBN6038349.1 hypothetical protein [Amycolatopsis sp. 195334CR]
MRWILPPIAGALLLAGCAPAADPGVGSTAQQFLDADPATACGLLSPRALEDLTRHGREPCADVLPTLRSPGGSVADVVVWGSDAQARTGAETLFLHQFEDGWRITGGGCTPTTADAPYRCLIGGP